MLQVQFFDRLKTISTLDLPVGIDGFTKNF